MAGAETKIDILNLNIYEEIRKFQRNDVSVPKLEWKNETKDARTIQTEKLGCNDYWLREIFRETLAAVPKEKGVIVKFQLG